LEKSLQLLRGDEHDEKNLQKMRVQREIAKAFRNSYDSLQKHTIANMFKDGMKAVEND
jgi:hypothetical protein